MRRSLLRTAALLVAAAGLAGCDPEDFAAMDAGPRADGAVLDGRVPTVTDAGSDAGSLRPDSSGTHAGAADGGAADGGAPPLTARVPCATRPCWLGTRALGACGGVTIPEDFSSGRYAVHQYTLTATAGSTVEARLEVTGGVWRPALLVLDPAGATLYDGERGAARGPTTVESIASGRVGSPAAVRITATMDGAIRVFVTSWKVIDSGFAGPMPPMDARYTLRASGNCPLGNSVCPVNRAAITSFGSGFYSESESSDRASPSYTPYKRDSRTSHHGYDVYVPRNTEIVAAQGGRIVEVVTTDTGDCGIAINISTASGVTFRYCHLNRVDVAVGSVVAVGQRVGLSGMTGNANAPHVHFGYLDGRDVNGSGLTARGDLRSPAVNAFIDGLCM
jgi:murein DD-endopeptidase MepM/ murein hydrolase activator NlpD